MLPPPKDSKLWEEYFLHVCSTRLELTLAKEEEQWNAADFSECVLTQSMINSQFRKLRDVLERGKDPCSFSLNIIRFRKEISKFISENLD